MLEPSPPPAASLHPRVPWWRAMTLRRRTLLILGLTLAGLIGGAFLVASEILLGIFDAADRREATERVARAHSLIQESLSVLDSKTGDWANWEECYAYMAGRNPGFIRTNLTDKTLQEIQVNVVLFISTSGRILHGQAFDLATGSRRPPLAGLEAHLGPASPLFDLPDESSRRSGLLLLPEGPLLVAARPILTAEGRGPIQGILVFGRLLDERETRRLTGLLRHPLTVHRLDDPALRRDLGGHPEATLAGVPSVVRPMDAAAIAGYALLSDIHGRPAAVLRALGPRPTQGERRSSLVFLLVSLVVVGLGFTAASLVFLERTVLTPLASLTGDVQRIGVEGGSAACVRIAGYGELARLATTVNTMLDALAQAREAERESQRTLTTLMANLPGLVYRCRNDKRWTVEFVSEGALALTGYAPQALLRNPLVSFRGLIHPDDLAAVQGAIASALAARRPFELTYRLRTAGGEWRWVWERGQGVSPGPDGAAGAIEGFITDVSDQIRTRRQLETVELVNQEISRELDLDALLKLILRRAVELSGATGGSLYLWDETAGLLAPRVWHGIPDSVGRLTLRLGEGLAGAALARRQGLSVQDYRSWPGAHSRFIAEAGILAALAEPLLYRDQPVGAILLHNHQPGQSFAAGDRALLGLLARQAAIAIQNARLFAAAQQATEDVRRAQAELVRSETLRGLGQMAAGIAHDLNNTLATILGQIELHKLRTPEPAEQEALALVETAALDGAQTVQRLLQFARPRGASALEAVDLAAAVREVAEITRPRWRDEPQRHGLTIRLVLELPELPRIVANPPELREVLTNLIFNAVDAMPHGGTLRFAARLVPAAEQASPAPNPQPPIPSPRPPAPELVQLTVSDTGIGMPPEVLARIFEPFFTTKGVRGTGLGLASAYGIIERFGGRVTAASAVGQGATFTLAFRQAAGSGSAGARPAPAHRAGRRVVVVDDEPEVRRTVAALLRGLGHQVTEASGGAMALQIVALSPPELVVTDLGMPEMNGWELARALKRDHPSLPVLLLTGWQEPAPAAEQGPSPVDRILGKPVRLETLRQVVAELTSPGLPGVSGEGRGGADGA